ncbi:MAG TPA: site-2 protease family protein [Polyangiaceae bacterium]|nr:site-2 protease family protein [Polyangiaceae bacterium]
MGILRFNLLGFPVHIQPGFWLLALLIGSAGKQGLLQSSILIAVIFVSVLVHELGHAYAARSYGQKPTILLHMMGGLTSWVPTHDIGRRRGIIVTLAGPLAGFALGLAAFAIAAAAAGERRIDGYEDSQLLWSMQMLASINFVWSTINLLPVLPFDGGQIMALALGKERRRMAATISLIFGLICAALLLKLGWVFAAVIFAMGGITSYLAANRQPEGGDEPRPEALQQLLRQAKEELDAGKLEAAASMAGAVCSASPDAELRQRAGEVVAWAAVMQRRAPEARAALARLPAPERADVLLLSGVDEIEENWELAAERLLVARRQRGDRRPQVAAALVRALLGAGRAGEAADLTRQILEQTDPEDARKVAETALEAGAAAEAGALWLALFELTAASGDALAAARAFVRAERVPAAIETLEAAVRAGGDAISKQIQSDPLLQALSGDGRKAGVLAGP